MYYCGFTTSSTQVPCYYFQNETLQIENTCTYKGSSWAGGGTYTLTWEDGIATTLSDGSGSRGTKKTCAERDYLVDSDVCATTHARSSKTLKRIPNDRWSSDR